MKSFLLLLAGPGVLCTLKTCPRWSKDNTFLEGATCYIVGSTTGTTGDCLCQDAGFKHFCFDEQPFCCATLVQGQTKDKVDYCGKNAKREWLKDQKK